MGQHTGMTSYLLMVALLLVAPTRINAWDSRSDDYDDYEDEEHNETECEGCVQNTLCRLGRCVCHDTHIGDPYFMCHKPQKGYCHLMNDPVLRTFAKEKSHVDVIGPTKLVQLVVRHPKWDSSIDFTLWAITDRIKGKYFVKSFQFRYVRSPQYRRPKEFQVLVESKVNPATGVYRWEIFLKDFGKQGSFRHAHSFCSTTRKQHDAWSVQLPGCTIAFRRIHANFLKTKVKCSGVAIGLRPHNPENREVKAGIWVTVDRLFQPQFTNWPHHKEPLCLSFDQRLSTLQASTRIANLEDALTFHSLVNSGPIHYPHKPADLTELKKVLRDCPGVARNAFSSLAGFMTRVPKFSKCVSENDGILSLVNVLLESARFFCNDDVKACKHVHAKLKQRCWHLKDVIPALKTFVEFGCRW
ncbi:unnamed protein product [Lymnaea stagnalis]|uniref:Secreted protein n=1 Tax=Lymnaea stagnalis TaxID=6523 RepID=A0AAV2I2G6_LYMST